MATPMARLEEQGRNWVATAEAQRHAWQRDQQTARQRWIETQAVDRQQRAAKAEERDRQLVERLERQTLESDARRSDTNNAFCKQIAENTKAARNRGLVLVASQVASMVIAIVAALAVTARCTQPVVVTVVAPTAVPALQAAPATPASVP